jgi:hypothetical protein
MTGALRRAMVRRIHVSFRTSANVILSQGGGDRLERYRDTGRHWRYRPAARAALRPVRSRSAPQRARSATPPT